LVPFFSFFYHVFFFKSSNKEAGTNTTKWRGKKKTRKREKHRIVNGNTRNNVGRWIFMEKIENNIKDKNIMCCIATERREN
jgi:hypothetical protein